MYNLNRINKLLNSKQVPAVQETNVVMAGPDTIKNILLNETVKLGKLEQVSCELINYLTDSRELKRLSRKEQQSLLRDIVAIQTNSRDFIFKVAELSSKNQFLQEVLKVSQGQTETVISENGEIFESSVTDSDRRHLSELLTDMLNDQTRG